MHAVRLASRMLPPALLPTWTTLPLLLPHPALCSTARNELGVVYARSPVGAPMVPISWQEMQCPRTKAVEQRKVAKV